MQPRLERLSWIAGIASALLAVAGLWTSNSEKEKELDRLRQTNTQVNQQTVTVQTMPTSSATANDLAVESLESLYVANESCPGSILVTERFALKADGDPITMIMSHSDHTGAVDMIRADGKRGLAAETSYVGWRYSYCAPKGWKRIYFVRFLDPATGRISRQLTVPIAVPA